MTLLNCYLFACMSDGEASQKLKITGGTKVQTILRQQQVWKHVIIMWSGILACCRSLVHDVQLSCNFTFFVVKECASSIDHNFIPTHNKNPKVEGKLWTLEFWLRFRKCNILFFQETKWNNPWYLHMCPHGSWLCVQVARADGLSLVFTI